MQLNMELSIWKKFEKIVGKELKMGCHQGKIIGTYKYVLLKDIPYWEKKGWKVVKKQPLRTSVDHVLMMHGGCNEKEKYNRPKVSPTPVDDKAFFQN